MKKLLVFLLCSIVCTPHALALDRSFKAGEYLSDEGYGSLTIYPKKNDRQNFELFSMGGNGHSCTVSGEIVEGKAKFEDGRCEIVFYRQLGGIEVAEDAVIGNDCTMFCGARAGFTGNYKPPAAGCGKISLATSLSTFQELKDQGQYAQAEIVLTSILADCRRTLDKKYVGYLRSQLAQVQAEQGKKQACFETLKPWIELARKSKDNLCNPPTGTFTRIPQHDLDKVDLCSSSSGEYTYMPPLDCDSLMATLDSVREALQTCEALP